MTDWTSELEWLDSTDKPTHFTRDEWRAMWDDYAAEGHLVFVGHVRGDHPGRSWVVSCTCGMVSTRTPWLTWRLRTWARAKELVRAHRANVGLEYQELAPQLNLSEWKGKRRRP